ncbi:unnamed protein product [Didymodactylos carnosus]|uniref:Endonuclease/exonuclease/phosphatase domain-containing protein n=1 Tax=Didymodactylos carnosus TaxID=1234261 RepID=A0A814DN01_9BILA|nr:unnamed protein product [Didymodactylos carnosus]CAF1595155.1 unnamed protein product [Didymodactylos carnosus]CAF3731259.1 unnamed protein product [Didymodactylos carnosus]CAF4400913.1 unnamed protein product [Didymodactylos carnosus]
MRLIAITSERGMNTPCSIVVFNGKHHDEKMAKVFSKHYSNYNISWEKRTNKWGGVLVAVHRSIPVQKVEVFQHIKNVIVLDIGTAEDKFQLATWYSSPKENLPVKLFDNILKRNSNTILMGDFNAEHSSWSNSIDNHKAHVLYNWLTTKTLEIVNKFVPTSTRSNATIDLILAPSHMIATTSFSVLPSIGSDHFPIIWTPTIKLHKRDQRYPIMEINGMNGN